MPPTTPPCTASLCCVGIYSMSLCASLEMGSVCSQILPGPQKDGSEFPVEIMLSPLESVDGILVTAAIRDISVRKDAEKILAQTTAVLTQTNKALVGTTKPIRTMELDALLANHIARRMEQVLGR